MADFPAITNRRRSRKPLGTIRGLSASEATGQTVTSTGASRAIRPKITAVRRMDNRGAGSVGYF